MLSMWLACDTLPGDGERGLKLAAAVVAAGSGEDTLPGDGERGLKPGALMAGGNIGAGTRSPATGSED